MKREVVVERHLAPRSPVLRRNRVGLGRVGSTRDNAGPALGRYFGRYFCRVYVPVSVVRSSVRVATAFSTSPADGVPVSPIRDDSAQSVNR